MVNKIKPNYLNRSWMKLSIFLVIAQYKISYPYFPPCWKYFPIPCSSFYHNFFFYLHQLSNELYVFACVLLFTSKWPRYIESAQFSNQLMLKLWKQISVTCKRNGFYIIFRQTKFIVWPILNYLNINKLNTYIFKNYLF